MAQVRKSRKGGGREEKGATLGNGKTQTTGFTGGVQMLRKAKEKREPLAGCGTVQPAHLKRKERRKN